MSVASFQENTSFFIVLKTEEERVLAMTNNL